MAYPHCTLIPVVFGIVLLTVVLAVFRTKLRALDVFSAFLLFGAAVLSVLIVLYTRSLRRAQQIQLDTEERLQEMADNIQEIVWMIDAETKKALYVNAAYETITGRSCQSVLENPSSYEDLIHPEDRVHVLTKLGEATQTGHFDERFRIVRADGEVRWVTVHGFPARDPNTPSPQQIEREKVEERKRIEKEKLAITTRHRILATILQRVSAPLKKADLLAVAHYLIGHLSYSQVPALAKRHKVEATKDSASVQELLAKLVGTYDDAELCKLLLEISLLDSAYQRSTASRDDILMDAAKRYRVDAEKLQKAVSAELAAKRDKKTKAKAKPKDRKTAA